MVPRDMMIKNVTLNNIRSFINFNKNFYKGFGFILGDNGTGKTTVLLSLGSILGFLSSKSLLRDGSSKGSIRLFIQIDGKEYDIYKELIRKGSSVISGYCNIKDEQGLHKLDSTELKEYTLNILNIKDSRSVKNKSEIFKYAIYCPQGEMIKILSTKKADIDERNQALRKTFRTEEYKNAREIAEKLENKIDKHVAYLKGQSDDVYKDRDQLILEDRAIGRINNENDRLLSQIEEYKMELKRSDDLKISKENERDKYNEAKGRIKQIGEEIKRLEVEKLGINGYIEKCKIQMHDVDRQIIILKEQSVDTYKNIDESLGINIDKLKEMIEKLKKEREDKVTESKQYIDVDTDIKIDIKIDINTDIKMIENDIYNKDRSKKAIILDIERYKDELFNIDSEICTLLKILPVDKSLEELKKDKENFENDIRELLVRKGIIDRNIKDLTKVKDKPICYTCGQKIEKNILENNIVINKEEYKNIEERLRECYKQLEFIKQLMDIQEKIVDYNITKKDLEIRVESGNREIIETDKKIEGLKNNLSEDKRKLEIYIGILNYAENIKLEIDRININILVIEKYNDIQERIRIYEQNILTIQNQIYESTNRLNSIDSMINSLIEENNLCTKESELYDFVSGDIRFIDNDIGIKTRELHETERKMSANNAVIKEKNNVISGLRNKIDSKERQIQTYKFLGEYNIFLNNGFIPSTTKIERKIFTRMRNRFNKYLQTLSLSIMNKKNIKVEVNEDFTPIVTRNDIIVDIDENDISGGEQASIAFAYRVALNMLVSELVGINLPLIFDEPTYGFSQTKLTNLRNSIRELRLKGLKNKQVIIVSHEEKFRDVADYVIKLVSIDEKTSTAED